MKTSLKLIFSLLFLFNLSCSENEKEIDRITEGTQNGGVLKTVSFFDILNLTTTPNVNNPDRLAGFTVEVIDIAPGLTTEEVRIYARYQSTGTIFVQESLLTVVPRSAFVNGVRYPEVRYSIDIPALNTFFGQNMINNRRVRFRLEQVLSDGRVFSDFNSSSIVRTGAFWNSPYIYTTRIVN